MSRYRKILLLLIILTVVFFLMNSTDNRDWEQEKEKAEKLYNEKKYDEAIILFREIQLSTNNEKLKAEMYFWLAKAYIETGKLEPAQENLEYYLKNYEISGLNYKEAVYQKGRLLFLQEQYQDSIEQFNVFLKKYPSDEHVVNAYYWIGECLYALGQYDDSSVFFNIVVSKFPFSIKNEASLFKLRLIEHKKSELALQNLLKWSSEQYMSALSQFRIREKTLQEALDKYKQGKTEETDILNKNKQLEAENNSLKEQINKLNEKINDLEKSNTKITSKDLADKMKQLELKEQLLKNKEEALRVLEEELRRKEKSLE